MRADPKYIREQYASLSDEALLEIDRDELVETAQTAYDEEVKRRHLVQAKGETPRPKDAPEWLDGSAEVYSAVIRPGMPGTEDAEAARDALVAADIPCYLEAREIEEDRDPSPNPWHKWSLVVPGNLHLQATSVLETEVFNPAFEEEWRAHLEGLSDEELGEMTPEIAFGGLLDKIQRVTKAYEEELERRGLEKE